jgi:DNA repair protein RecO (recombination protein O)
VLRTQELGEADLIVSLLTERHGKVRGVAPHARKSRRRFGGALEPLTHVRAAWSQKEGRDLHRIESLECVRSFANMQADPLHQAVCAVISELSEAFAREGEEDGRSFRLLGAALVALEEGSDPWVVIRYFEYWILRLHGLLPDLQNCASCSVALSGARSLRVVRGRGLLCKDCLAASGERGLRLAPEHLAFISEAKRSLPGALETRPATVKPGSALEALLRGTIESFAERKFRTYRHMQAASGADAGWSDQR